MDNVAFFYMQGCHWQLVNKLLERIVNELLERLFRDQFSYTIS